MLFRIIFILILQLLIKCETKRLNVYEYKVSSFSQLVLDDNGRSEHRHQQQHDTTLRIFEKTKDSFFGKFEIIQNLTFNISELPFQVILDEGLVKNLKVSPEISQWQIEFIRAVVGPFQVSTKALRSSNREFWVMEDTISGNCNTHYNKTYKANYGRPYYEFVKTKDYANCTKLPVFHRGIYRKHNLVSLLNDKDGISRKTVSSIILIENRNDYYVNSSIVQSEALLQMKDYSLKADTLLSITFMGTSNYDVGDFSAENLTSVAGLSLQTNSQRYSYYDDAELLTHMSTEIAEELKHASVNPLATTLSRFAVLVRIIRNLNHDSIENISSSITLEEPNDSKWVLHSAIYMAGTLNALKMLKYFFHLKYISWYDNDLMLGLPNRLESVTLDHLKQFHEIIELLHDSFNYTLKDQYERNAFSVFSNLFRRYYEENILPSKPLSADCQNIDLESLGMGKEDQALYDGMLTKYWSLLDKKLNETIQSDKTSNPQKDFYYCIQALGNLGNGHLYEEFINGSYNKIKNKFQKVLAINAMDKIIELEPNCAQKILLHQSKEHDSDFTLQWTINQLVKTDFDVDLILKLLKRISITNFLSTKLGDNKEPIKSSYIPTDEIYNAVYQNKVGDDFYTFFLEAIGGYTELPWYTSMDVKINRRGYGKRFKVAGMLNRIIHFFYGDGSNPVSTGNIMLNYEWNQYSYFFQNLSFWTIEEALKQWTMDRKPEANKRTPERSLSLDTFTIDLPLDNGYLFRYNYDQASYSYLHTAPSLLFTGAVGRDIHFLRSKLEQMNIGIVNPFNGIQYLFGNERTVQFNLPLKYYLTIPRTIRLEPLFNHGNQRIIHFSNSPYFTERSIHSIVPITEEDTFEYYITGRRKYENFRFDEYDRFVTKVRGCDDVISSALREVFLWDVNNMNGPFKSYPSKHYLYNLWFDEDLGTRPLVFISLGTIKNGIVIYPGEYGNVTVPIPFNDSNILNIRVSTFSRNHGSATLTLKKSENYKTSQTTKYEAKIDYHNYFYGIEIEICGSLTYNVTRIRNGNTVLAYVELKYGCANSSLISLEVELSRSGKRYLNVTIYFENVNESIASSLCSLKSEYKGPVNPLLYPVNVFLKNEEKCEIRNF